MPAQHHPHKARLMTLRAAKITIRQRAASLRKRNGFWLAWHPLLLCLGELEKKLYWHSHELTIRTMSPFSANIYLPVIPAVARDFHKSIELINLTVTMYMIFQGICACIPSFTIGTLSHQSIPHDQTSSDVLGNAVRPSGAQANHDRLFDNPFGVLCRASSSPNISLLAVDALTMFPSGGIGEHLCCWYVYLIVEHCWLEELMIGTITIRCWDHFRHIHSS